MNEYSLTFNEQDHYWDFRFLGDVLDFPALITIIKKVMPKLDARSDRRFIGDWTRARIALDRIEISFIPGLLESYVFDRSWKRAIIGRDRLDDFRYYEKLARERGEDLKLFTDSDEARAWILEKTAV